MSVIRRSAPVVTRPPRRTRRTPISSCGTSISATTEAPVSVYASIMPVSTSESSTMMSSPSITTKGSSPTCLRATETAWPSPSGSPWRT